MNIDTQNREGTSAKVQPFRLDVQLHELLQKPEAMRSFLQSPPSVQTEKLPKPVFPQHPALLTDAWLPQDEHGAPDNPYRRHWTASQVFHTMQGWMFPYLKSRILPGDFHPIIAYLFTEWKCNLDCHYCWAFDNNVKGMSEDMAKRSIDWLHSTTCRVLALMGGEPLLRPDFAHKVVYYAAKKGFWVYVPTNARLLRPEVIDRLADAGVSTVNFAVDTVAEKPGLPKALNPVRKYFDYLIRKQYRYGYTVFFNMNICRTNMEDIQQLTEIAHDNGIATDYHINESPMLDQPQFKHLDDNSTYITQGRLAESRRPDRLDHREESIRLQDGQFGEASRGHESLHARTSGAVELPGRTEQRDHPSRWNLGALLPHVFGVLRLGQDREPQV